MNLTGLTIREIHQGLSNKDFSVLELTRKYLDKIGKEDKKVNSFLTVSSDSALLQAKKTDEMIARDKNIPMLAGTVVAVKDIILAKDIRCTAGSKILENYIAPYDATCVERLKKQGVIVLGKTNLDEFAMGSSTENSAFGPTKNPHDLTRVPGGSSGGSAAAVSANFCSFALGTDTGGSVRQPASFCGIVGLNPTYGAVSRYGLISFASSLDQAGPMTKTVEDCKIVFDIISGKDELDSTSVEAGLIPQYTDFKIKDMVIGVPKEYFVEGIDPKVLELINNTIKVYQERGAKVEEISLPHQEYSIPCYYIIVPSEASANLARYDGIKYGYSKSKVQNLIDVYLESRGEGFGDEVRRRIMLGAYVLSAGYYEAYYLRAQKVRTLIKRDFDRAFEKVDVIFTPVSPTPAFKLGEKTKDPLKMYLSDILTASVKLAGLPAISVPCGKVDGLPVGLQIIGKPFEDRKIMDVAGILEEQ
ncbi:MAG: Asp-tRNA(Asn)/Glu-tRNA(Gln) amidotransferase subunit GatA [Patescibacteria group bacterium]|nr:Asp-tRNA(Asn)/Glu-tRNA(Gln) amidotransferase subunit GatA [Patescibacteria group bacterium]